MIAKTSLSNLDLTSVLENYTLPLVPGENGYEECVGDEYALLTYHTSPAITASYPSFTPTLETSMTLYSLSTDTSSDVSKIYYDESDISVYITNGEYYQTHFNST